MLGFVSDIEEVHLLRLNHVMLLKTIHVCKFEHFFGLILVVIYKLPFGALAMELEEGCNCWLGTICAKVDIFIFFDPN